MNKSLINNFSVNLPNASTHCAIPDVGTTENCTMCDTFLLSKRQINNGPTVLPPDNSTMKATNVGTLIMLSLPTKASTAYEFPTSTK